MPSAMAILWLLNALKGPMENQNHSLLPYGSCLDWDGLIPYADRQGIAPLLYHQLLGDADLWAAIPSSAQQQLRLQYLCSENYNTRIYDQVLQLIKILKQYDIPVIVLKGLHLAHAVYDNRALRPMGDGDILVKRNDISRVESVLQAMGYRFSDWKYRDWCLRNHYHLAYSHPELHVNIELHWHIQKANSPYPVKIEDLWRDAQPITIDGVEVLGLAIEHLLLYHCLHIARHGFKVGLRPFYDLAAILGRYHEQIEWQPILEQAQCWRVAKAFSLSLYLTHEFFGGVPGSILEALKSATANAELLETTREQIFAFGSQSAQLSAEFLQLVESDQYQKKPSQLLRRIFLSPDLMARIYNLSLHSWRLYLYYSVRLFELLIRYPHSLRQLVRQDQAMLTWTEQRNKAEMLRKWLET